MSIKSQCDHSVPRILNVGEKFCLTAPLHLVVAIAWLLGLYLGFIADLMIRPLLFAGLILLTAVLLPFLSSRSSLRTAALLAVVFLAGVARWELFHAHSHEPFASETPHWDGVFEGKICTVPVVYQRPDSQWAVSYGSSERTTFEIAVLLIGDRADGSASEVWRVSLSGNARGMFSCGDSVRIQGKAVRPPGATNPGQFDFRAHLRSRGIARQLFVNHPSAVVVTSKAAWWSPFRWASWLRADAERILDSSLLGRNRQLAMAMFLGTRSQLPFDLRDAFVASGTMHLLAISGLHVGILSLFVLRLFHSLGLSRSTSLVAMILVICGYAMVTGFRPSVVRATLFLLLFAVSQLIGRRQRLIDLLSMTALIMTIWSPGLLSDTGAWLSFLSIGALAWYSSCYQFADDRRDVPDDLPSVSQAIGNVFKAISKQLRLRYCQMLSILLFTLPLTTSEFHVLSPVSLLVNVLLILYTFFVLAAGYLTLIVGVLLPALAWIPASVFSGLLSLFAIVVGWASNLPHGHFYLSDFPVWFLPLWYGCLAAMVVSRHPSVHRVFMFTLCLLAVGAIGSASQEPAERPLTATVLDIGHGSASIIECGDRVVLVDAGSLNQGRRAAEIVSEFLWSRGWNRIDEIVISHADSDHYNAVPTLISRFPIGQVVTSHQFVRSTDNAVQEFLAYADEANITVKPLAARTSSFPDGSRLEILQPDSDLLPADVTDNEISLVVKVVKGESAVLLPGDLEKRGLSQLLGSLGQAGVLVSPHHGSRSSNPAELAAEVRPQLVLVSARDAASRMQLERVYCDSEALWWTSEAGAVELSVQSTMIQATAFGSGHHRILFNDRD